MSKKNSHGLLLGRRAFIGAGTAALATLATTAAQASVAPLVPLPPPPKRALGPSALPKIEKALALENLHTGERLKRVYWAGGTYVPDAVREMDRVLRDHRTNEVHRIDRRLFDLLHELQRRLNTNEPFQIISGYRSSRTNEMLRARGGGGVAKRSLHMDGMAIDIALKNRSLSELRQAALSLQAGGVGYYPKSGFVHVDTGKVRSW